MTFPRTVRRIAVLLAAAALLAGPTVSRRSRRPRPPGTRAGSGWPTCPLIRPAMDVYLYSFGDPSARIVLRHIAYGTVSAYQAVAAGDYSLAMRPAGAVPHQPAGPVRQRDDQERPRLHGRGRGAPDGPAASGHPR